MKSAEQIVSKEVLAELRKAGFVVVHSKPTSRMTKAVFRRGETWDHHGTESVFNRMVGASIAEQNEAMKGEQ